MCFRLQIKCRLFEESVIFLVLFFFFSSQRHCKNICNCSKISHNIVVMPSGSKFLHLVRTRKSKKALKYLFLRLSVSLQLLFWYISVINFLFPLLTIATLFLSDSTQMCKPHHSNVFLFQFTFFSFFKVCASCMADIKIM